MTTIYLVRHGSVHNPRNILYGRLPRFRLSNEGLEQARRAACFLSSQPVTAIYCSPRLRARQTATAVAELVPTATLHYSRLLDEVRTSWQGADSGALGRDFNFYEPLRHPSDETIDHIYERMARMVRTVRRRHEGGSVVCVSHGDPIMILRTGLAGLPLLFASLRQDGYPTPASITILRFHSSATRPHIEYVDPCAECLADLDDKASSVRR